MIQHVLGPSAPARTHPRLCFVGPMVGVHRGLVTTQGFLLSRRFASAGYPVIACSSSRRPLTRLLNIMTTLVRERRRIDIQVLEVYSGRSFVFADAASVIGRRLGQKIVMALHGGALPEFSRTRPSWVRRVLRRADVIVTPSPYLARCSAGLGYPARIIPNAIEAASYPFRLRESVEPRLLWMRTFDSVYNPRMALRALRRIREERPGATLCMAGQERGMLEEVRRTAAEMGLGGSVTFPGFLDTAGKAREGGRADIFLTTSRVDNTPVSALEACALGLPVVATEVGGIPDLFTEGETALLVPSDDDEAMAVAVRRLLDEKGLAGRLSSQGRALAERCDWGVVRTMWEEVFAECMGG